MASSRHIRTSSGIPSHHTRTASTSSEILITETVSSLQRCVFGNVFRSQRQLTRFGLFLALFVFAVYMLGPFGSGGGSSGRRVPDPKPKALNAVRSVADEERTETEYRATYFEEMGKRIANQEWHVRADSLHSNNHLSPEVKEEEVAQQGSRSGSGVESELKAIAEKVREAARVLSACKEIPGLLVVMVKGDRSVQVPFGMADVSAGRPVTTETRFLLGSVSKTFLGQLLGVLITESGRNLTWDTRVSHILGSDFQLATEELTREVTLADLLSHRSGLSSGNLAVRSTFPPGWTRAQLVKNFKHLPPSAPFRKTFLYSNMASTLAAHVAETLGGAPWEKLIVDKLLAPLGMPGSRPIRSMEELDGDGFSRLYVPVEGTVTKADSRIFNLGPLAPVGLLSSTAKDITQWLQFNLRQGALPDGRPLIRRDLWLPMWSKQAELSPHFLKGADKSGEGWPVKDVSEGYGLFWFRNRYRGLMNLWHGGALYSHYTLAWHFPERQVALYAVINGHSGDSRPFYVLDPLMYHAADLLLGHEPWVEKNSLCTFSELFGHPSSNQTKSNTQGEGQWRDAAEQDGDRNAAVGKTNDDGNENKGREGGGRWERTGQGNGAGSDNNNDDGGGGGGGGSALLFRLEKFATAKKPNLGVMGSSEGAAERFGESAAVGEAGVRSGHTPLPLEAYYGTYRNPLFGNFSVFYKRLSSGTLACQLHVMSADLNYRTGHGFGLVYTKSHRFLSKPSKTVPEKESLAVTFLEGRPREITAVDVASEWGMEVALRFVKVR